MPDRHKTLSEQMKESLNFNIFIHRARPLIFHNVFVMIVGPVCKRRVIHSPVIHSSRSLVRFFAAFCNKCKVYDRFYAFYKQMNGE